MLTKSKIKKKAAICFVIFTISIFEYNQVVVAKNNNIAEKNVEFIKHKSRNKKTDTTYFLLDYRNINLLSNVKLVLGKPIKNAANPLFGPDKPWEQNFDNFYGNVIYDSGLKEFRVWYLNFINGKNSLLYAYSYDGIKWLKPDLGMVSYEGNTHNNIVLMGAHGVGVFEDKQETAPGRKYKMFSRAEQAKPEQGLQVDFSPDGLHWRKQIPQQQISAKADTHNNALWAPTLNRYVAFTRKWNGVRLVARTESTNFLDWKKAEVVLEGLDPLHQTYAMPVFYYKGIYLGLLAILNKSSDERVHTELTWSPDTKKWYRINPGKSFIPNSEKKGAYDYGMLWGCATPIVRGDSILIYYAGFDLHHGAIGRKGHLCLATLGEDKWAGYEAENTEGEILTSPLKITNRSMRVSADINTGGYVQVEIVNRQGKILDKSTPVNVGDINTPLKWSSNEDISIFATQQVQIRFKLKNATLYSYSFID